MKTINIDLVICNKKYTDNKFNVYIHLIFLQYIIIEFKKK